MKKKLSKEEFVERITKEQAKRRKKVDSEYNSYRAQAYLRIKQSGGAGLKKFRRK